MSRLAAPGFSRLKAPGYSSIRPPSAIVSSANGTAAPQNTSAQQIPSARSALKKPSQASENQQEQTKVVKPVIPGLSQQKGSKSSTKLAANQAAQHGTGPYDLPTSQSSGTIPYVGKKRPSGVLKAPDSRTNMTKPQLTNGTDKRNETIVADPKVAKKKIIPPKSTDNGTFAVPGKPTSKRMSVPVNKYQGCSDLTKIDSPRRQTIGTPDSTRSNSKLGSAKNPVGIRPRSCVMPTKSTEIKKPDQKKSISKSLQNIPKSIPGIPLPSMNKGLNKKDVRKSGSHDDILNCTKKEPTIKRPVAGVIPRTKSGGFTSKFGFSKPPEQPRPRSATGNTNSTTTISSTPHQINQDIKKFEDHKLSPISGGHKSSMPNRLEEEFDVIPHVTTNTGDASFNVNQPIIDAETVNGTAEICEVMDIENVINETVNKTSDDHSDTKTINIIINLDTVSTSQEFNTTATLSKNDGICTSATLNGNKFDTTSTPNKTRNIDLDLNKTAIINSNDHLNSTPTMNKTNNTDLNATKTLNGIGNLSSTVPFVNGNETFDASPPLNETRNISLDTSPPLNETRNINLETSPSLNETRNINFNTTRTLDDEHCKYLNSGHTLHENINNCLNRTVDIATDSAAILNKTHTLFDERDLLNQTHTIDTGDAQNLNQTVVLDSHGNVNTTQILPGDSVDKSDSGFDDTNFNISDIVPPAFTTSMNEDVSYNGDLSEDVLKVIAAISSNINRPSNITTFSQSPIKNDISTIPRNEEYICSVATGEQNHRPIEDGWLNDEVSQEGPLLEDTISISQTSHEDESHTLYQTDDLLSKSTSIDMSTVTSNNTQWQENSNLMKFSSNYSEIAEVIENRTYIEDEVFKDNIDVEDVSLCTDISQSTDQLRNCLSSIGTDTEDIEDIEDTLPDVNPDLPLNSQEDSIFIGVKSHEIDDESSITDRLSNIGLPSHEASSSMNSTHTLINRSVLDRSGLDVDRVNDIEIPTSIEYSDINASITDKTSGICYTNDTTLENCSESISKEIADAIIRDSGHSTDVNENEINSALSADLNKLNIDSVKADLFGDEFTEHISEICPSTPPTEFEKSMSSDATYPSTPLSRQESLEYDLARRCNTIDCSRKMRKVARSRTYSSSELITKFRIPKELKCIETSEGDILMDKTTFLHFMNEVKLVKTSLLKLKRTLVEAQCTSPLVKSPLKRANSAVEASAIPPLSPRTCQCSPMAVVNPLVLTTGSVSTATKEKESILSLEEQIAFLNEKLEDSASTVKALQTQLVDSASTVKLLQTQLENHEQKEQDIIEENILLREEISHLTERLRNARVTEGVGEDGTPGSFEEFDLAVDLDSRLSILQRLYSDG